MSANQSPILIVDDEKDNLEALQRLLRGKYDVTITASPIEALKLVQATHYHVIVSDQRMPEMTGVELLEKVKKLSPSTTRILLTGYTDTASVVDAINRGNIYRYIAKPWDPDDFKITLNQADEAYKMRKELEEKNVQLSKAVEELKSLDKAKSRFLSLVSHELNTPLTVLSSFVNLLESEKKALQPEIQKFVSSITEASHRFSEIVSEVLLYLKLSATSDSSLKESDISKDVAKAGEVLKKELEKKKVNLKTAIEKGLKHRLDPERFKILIEKLVGDAIVRASPGSDLDLQVSKKENRLFVVVKRTGEALDKSAFQPLEAASNPMHHQKNLGLSLATAKLIVDSHQGRIESKSEGGTQVVEVELP